MAARLAPLVRPAILLALAPNLVWGISTMLVYTYVAPILGPSFSSSTIAALLLVYGCGGLLGSIIGGRLADRFGPVRPIVVCMIASAIILSIWGLVNGHLVSDGILIFLYALAGWTIGAPQQMRVIRIDPASAAVTLALNNATYYLGSAIGAALGGLLLGVLAPVDLTFVSTGFGCVAVGLVVLSARLGRRTPG
jgi:predicted MFS family arabinose efflux permease